MKFLAIAIMLAASTCFAQTEKPNVTVEKMTDAEYRALDSASEAMQKAAEAYRKAADEYATTKQSVLSKHNALESSDCHIQKIVDIRGQYVIVEIRPSPYANGFGGCSSVVLTPAYGTTFLNQ